MIKWFAHMLHNFKSLNILHHMVNSVGFGGYANDDNRRAERWMMGSLGTPGDQPRNFWKKPPDRNLMLRIQKMVVEATTSAA